jgi:hypothetical protein
MLVAMLTASDTRLLIPLLLEDMADSMLEEVSMLPADELELWNRLLLCILDKLLCILDDSLLLEL